MTDIIGVILAGGLARRMGGGDKSLRLVEGRPILAHVIERFRPQVACLFLNANGDPARFAPFGLEILPDGVAGFPGPLAGVLAGLDRAAALGLDWIVTAPADAPFIPLDLVARLQTVRGQAPMAMAASGGRTHPVAALWPVSMRGGLRATLEAGERKVGAATAGAAVATWPDHPVDPFFNVNTPDDLARAAEVNRP
ncbi:MAG: molybdenum cofactor guanylyltransferase MobA [Acetobacteraceae bacterium]|nr:molybdenum cofactor guanylyltransferase MobA [Acetobacteraceae bacterium]